MSNLVDKISTIPGLCAIEGCTSEQVEMAQNVLGIIFPEEYIEYVRQFGCIDFGAVEWTGLNIKGRLNTVDATLQEMSVNHDFPKGFFVLEDLGIDAKKVIVNEKGQAYLLQRNKKTYLCNSISDYLDMCLKRR